MTTLLNDDFQKLLMQCKTKNKKAFIAFYSIFFNKIYYYCNNLVNNTMEAEDIRQDTFIKIYENIDSFKGNAAAMQKYINRIALNKCKNYINERKRFGLVAFDDSKYEIADSKEQMLHEDDFKIDILKEKISTLPKGYRIVLQLHLFNNMSFNRIAQLLNIKPSSVRSQYLRGTKKLRKILNLISL